MSAVTLHDVDELRDLYRELILDHARSPRHFGKLDGATHTAEGINPLCGDKLRLYMRLDDDNIEDASFEGSGCAISVASASLLTDMIIGLPVPQALEFFATVTARLTGRQAGSDDATPPELDKIRALDGVREFPSRVKCATLAWHALNSAIHGESAPVSTE
ncbi:MAG: SUF system NifU family Fe-S cluster assembly protein [Gammaproteobacteria bacterium]|nr:SUF system NifU family Fe-S cluster assembly protein [Gammaproteobacteria bacterium]MDH3371994.1 SUF system NifU family Fe-S cluster assembly protein [Gammaproteobacteria bacterium]MDH3408530.1 SUF system NifU family Fe-S cluster assembly protein [Gammaproteobacteria bacterium]MDH3552415.1 SUF system NifU family Fe-S cluster assembly protein [Gammaproteobacteria bacterium]